jgi:hypothetical protein
VNSNGGSLVVLNISSDLKAGVKLPKPIIKPIGCRKNNRGRNLDSYSDIQFSRVAIDKA